MNVYIQTFMIVIDKLQLVVVEYKEKLNSARHIDLCQDVLQLTTRNVWDKNSLCWN
jgi:hypothetical protein